MKKIILVSILMLATACSSDSNSNKSNRVDIKSNPLPQVNSCQGFLFGKKMCGTFYSVGGENRHILEFKTDCSFSLSRLFADGSVYNNSEILNYFFGLR